jgi:hypothetical protein
MYCTPAVSARLPVLTVTGVKPMPDGAVITAEENSAGPVVVLIALFH